MSGIKSILVHLAPDQDHMARLRAGYNLCKRFNAHMSVLAINTHPHLPSGSEGRVASLSFLEQEREVAAEKNKAMESELDQWRQESEITYDWRQAEGDHLEALVEESLYHDLAIVSQSEPSSLEDMLFVGLPDHLPLLAACPVIVLPNRTAKLDMGKRIFIAWKPGQEAARAVRAALPFLDMAEHVKVFTVAKNNDDKARLDNVLCYLKRHGIEPEVEYSTNRSLDAHDQILDSANAMNADLLVMGGSSQRKMLRLVLGRDTRKILSRTHAPVLMCH